MRLIKFWRFSANLKFSKKNSVVLDLGAAPGGWSQVAARTAKRVIAIDLLEVSPLSNVEFIKGNFTDDVVIQKVNQLVQNQKFDVILSDMAPNTCGIKQVDHLRIIGLLEAVYDFCKLSLKTGGTLVIKIFQGGAFGGLLADIKKHFSSVNHFKPLSSRKESCELYLIARDYRP